MGGIEVQVQSLGNKLTQKLHDINYINLNKQNISLITSNRTTTTGMNLETSHNTTRPFTSQLVSNVKTEVAELFTLDYVLHALENTAENIIYCSLLGNSRTLTDNVSKEVTSLLYPHSCLH